MVASDGDAELQDGSVTGSAAWRAVLLAAR
jgi:hypothetical protein